MPPKKTTKRKSAVRNRGQKPGHRASRWSAQVTRHSSALALEPAVFKYNDPRRIASSLKRSAERSRKRKASPYQSAMSMLNFYINRAGRSLPRSQKTILTRSKDELRKAFGRGPA